MLLFTSNECVVSLCIQVHKQLRCSMIYTPIEGGLMAASPRNGFISSHLTISSTNCTKGIGSMSFNYLLESVSDSPAHSVTHSVNLFLILSDYRYAGFAEMRHANI